MSILFLLISAAYTIYSLDVASKLDIDEQNAVDKD